MLEGDTGQVRRELAREHTDLAATLAELSTAASRGDPRALQELWGPFERELLRHLDLEEQSVLPLVEPAHPEAVAKLLSEHDVIRSVVSEIGVCCDLHAVRKDSIEALVRMLDDHAKREDETVYRWVDEIAPMGNRRHLLDILKRTVRAELGSPAAPAPK
jgi:hemerythrin superfamily protein